MSIEAKSIKLEWRNSILEKVKNYIDLELNPKRVNFLDKSKDGFFELETIPLILRKIGLR